MLELLILCNVAVPTVGCSSLANLECHSTIASVILRRLLPTPGAALDKAPAVALLGLGDPCEELASA